MRINYITINNCNCSFKMIGISQHFFFTFIQILQLIFSQSNSLTVALQISVNISVFMHRDKATSDDLWNPIVFFFFANLVVETWNEKFDIKNCEYRFPASRYLFNISLTKALEYSPYDIPLHAHLVKFGTRPELFLGFIADLQCYVVGFPPLPHNRHPIARPRGRDMGVCCKFKVWSMFCVCQCVALYNNV